MLVAWDKNRTMGVVGPISYKQIMKNGATLKLRPIKTIKVIAQDPAGKRLQGAMVSLEQRDTSYSWRKRTDSNGEASFRCMFWGADCRANIEMEGYYSGQNNMAVAGPNNTAWKDTMIFSLDEARRTQKGKVVDAKGKPVAGVEVNSASGPTAVTNAQGEFELKNMPDGNVPVYVYTDSAYGSTEVSKDSGDAVIKLNPPRSRR